VRERDSKKKQERKLYEKQTRWGKETTAHTDEIQIKENGEARGESMVALNMHCPLTETG
jgi:hypothetical protein